MGKQWNIKLSSHFSILLFWIKSSGKEEITRCSNFCPELAFKAFHTGLKSFSMISSRVRFVLRTEVPCFHISYHISYLIIVLTTTMFPITDNVSGKEVGWESQFNFNKNRIPWRKVLWNLKKILRNAVILLTEQV